MAQKKKDPWGSTDASPFASTHNEVTGTDASERIYEDDPYGRWDPGTMGNKRGWKNGVYYDNSGGGGGNPHGMVGGRGGGGGPCKPGYVMAEDGTCVPADYWDKAKGKTGTNTKTGKPIVW